MGLMWDNAVYRIPFRSLAMARRSASQPTSTRHVTLTSSREEVAEKLAERIRLGYEIQNRTPQSPDDMGQYILDIGKWRDYNLQLLKRVFTDSSVYREYYGVALNSYIGSPGTSAFMRIPELRNNVYDQISKLESIHERLDLIDEAAADRTEATSEADLSKVFVVHGHDEGAREGVARFIRDLGFQPIILHERANEGLTVIEKVEAHGDVGFAVVLLTPDDEGCEKGGTPGPRARQNVVLELGYFIGRLGRNRVCALKRGELEIPSDFGGVVYEPFDASGGWKLALARELRAAGFEIDWNKVPE
jgi:predicted nucleotide-binding protein